MSDQRLCIRCWAEVDPANARRLGLLDAVGNSLGPITQLLCHDCVEAFYDEYLSPFLRASKQQGFRR